MKIIYLGALVSVTLLFVLTPNRPPVVEAEKPLLQVEEVKAVEVLPEVEILKPKASITHAQMVWIHALEWCESSGKPSAVNPMDADGTPSYGAFQFKPSTFWHFASKYDVGITKVSDVHLDRDNQYEVVAAMVAHRGEIEWHNQFPGCVKKLGTPPSY